MSEQHAREAIDRVNRQVVGLYQQGNYREALARARQAVSMARQQLGEEHPDTATSLDNLGGLLQAMGDLQAARPYREQALTIRRKALGEEHPDTAGSLNNLGYLLQALGDLPAARPYYEQALAINHKALGEDHPNTAGSLNNLGYLLQALGDLQAARPCFEQALTIYRKALGEDHPDTARSLNLLGVLLQTMGDLQAARPYYEQALAIYRKALGEDHPDTARGLNNLGTLLQAMGDLQAARPYYEQALTIKRKALGEDHPDTARSLNNLGALLREMGDLQAAQPCYEQALAIRRKALGEDHPDTAGSLNNLGALLQALGDFQAARPYYEQALAIRRKALGEEHPDTARSLNNLGTLLREMGDLQAARPYYEQALTVRRKALGEDHPDTAGSLNNLGALLQAMGDLPAARPYYEQALAIYRKALGEDHPDTATSLNNLGALLQAMGDLQAARPYLEQALAITRKALGEDHPDTAGSLHNLGYLLDSMGDLQAARPCYEQALAIHRKALGEDHPDTATSLNNLAGLFAGSGCFREAGAMMLQAAAIDDRMIGQIFSIGSDSQRLGFLRGVQTNLEVFLSLVSRHLADSPDAIRSALDLVLRRKALTAEALAAQRDAILGGRYPHLVQPLKQLTGLRKQIAQKALAGPAAGESARDHQRTLQQWRAEQEQLESALARQLPEMDLRRKLQAADRRAVALALPEGVALIEFVRFNVFDFHAVIGRGEPHWAPARYLAFVLHGGQPDAVRMIDLGEAAAIDLLIADFRAGLTGERGTFPIPVEETDPAGRPFVLVATAGRTANPPPRAAEALHQKLFAPLLPALGVSRRLLLCPDGDLTRLPFEVLPSDGGGLLLDDYRISYLSNGRDVLRFAVPATATPAAPVVAADPDFDLAATGPACAAALPPAQEGQLRDLHRDRRAGRLPGTRVEGERIAARLGVAPLLSDAVLDARLQQLRSPRILHLATHGYFLEDKPYQPARRDIDLFAADRLSASHHENPLLRSGLLLAGFNVWNSHGAVPAEAEDGLLTAEDVTRLDLSDTELVVLSACETGLGHVHAGEGVFGLRRAFVLAGARALVMSLWKVPDLATAVLMDRFYHNLLDVGMARTEALREAQRYTRDITVAQLRTAWLGPDTIAKLSAGDDSARRTYELLSAGPDQHTPFRAPFYWGAFICQGEPGDVVPPGSVVGGE